VEIVVRRKVRGWRENQRMRRDQGRFKRARDLSEVRWWLRDEESDGGELSWAS